MNSLPRKNVRTKFIWHATSTYSLEEFRRACCCCVARNTPVFKYKTGIGLVFSAFAVIEHLGQSFSIFRPSILLFLSVCQYSVSIYSFSHHVNNYCFIVYFKLSLFETILYILYLFSDFNNYMYSSLVAFEIMHVNNKIRNSISLTNEVNFSLLYFVPRLSFVD